jgi:hypothetical protein
LGTRFRPLALSSALIIAIGLLSPGLAAALIPNAALATSQATALPPSFVQAMRNAHFSDAMPLGRLAAWGIRAADAPAMSRPFASSAGASFGAPGQVGQGVGPNVQISSDPFPVVEPGTEVEPDIAVNPSNGKDLVGVVQQGRFAIGGSVDPGFATSIDGGKTWVSGSLPGLTKAVGGTYDASSDPAVAFGPHNMVYAATIPFDETTAPSAVAINISTDGGLTWSKPSFVQRDDNMTVFNDKEWIAADASPTSPYEGNVYVAWDRSGMYNGRPAEPILLRRSTDGGKTWGPLVLVSKPLALSNASSAFPLVEPNGDVVVIWQEFTVTKVVNYASISTDGGQTFGVPILIANIQGGNVADERAPNIETAAVDPVTGNLYVAWQDSRFRANGLNDIVLSESTDGGHTWSTPVRVNSDPVTNSINHFTPGIAVSPGGKTISVSYFVRHDLPSISPFVLLYYSVSHDGGKTWSAPIRVQSQVTNLLDAAYVCGNTCAQHVPFLGDYQADAATATTDHPIWCEALPPANGKRNQPTFSDTLTR